MNSMDEILKLANNHIFVLSNENITKLAHLYLNEKLSFGEIGKIFNLPAFNIYECLVKLNILPFIWKDKLKTQIKELLDLNKSHDEIKQLLNVSDKKIEVVERIIEKRILTINNSIEFHNIKVCDIIEKYSQLIIDIIQSGKDLATIHRLIPHERKRHLSEAIKRLNLYDKWKENANKLRAERNIINAKKAGLIKKSKAGTGELNKPITEEMIIDFKEYVRLDLYHSDACRIFHKKFKTSARFNDLDEKYGKLKRKPAKFQSGELNPMYLRPPGDNSGIGISGHIILDGKKILFRSTLELQIYLYLFDNNIKFNLSNHRIKYINEKGNLSTYCPDIVIDETIYEIKPKALIKWPRNVLKFNALSDYCLKYNLKCDYITYETFDIAKYNTEYILELIQKNCILVNNKNLERFKKQKI